MATIPTQNAVPSEAPRDLKFNSGKIDEFVTSLEHEYKDRFGRCHMTIDGMKWMFDQLVLRFKVDINQAIISAGYITVDSFQQGAQLPNNEITQRNQILRDETTGEYYRWDGELPKSVPAGSTPESAGGIGKGAWIDIGGANLRTDLKADNGFTFVGGLTENYLRVFDNVAEMVAETSLPLGATVKTRGYYSPGDGGEGIYTVTNNQPDTLVNVILDNGLTATLDVTNGADILSVGAQENTDIGSILVGLQEIAAVNTILIPKMSFDCNSQVKVKKNFRFSGGSQLINRSLRNDWFVFENDNIEFSTDGYGNKARIAVDSDLTEWNHSVALVIGKNNLRNITISNLNLVGCSKDKTGTSLMLRADLSKDGGQYVDDRRRWNSICWGKFTDLTLGFGEYALQVLAVQPKKEDVAAEGTAGSDGGSWITSCIFRNIRVEGALHGITIKCVPITTDAYPYNTQIAEIQCDYVQQWVGDAVSSLFIDGAGQNRIDFFCWDYDGYPEKPDNIITIKGVDAGDNDISGNIPLKYVNMATPVISRSNSYQWRKSEGNVASLNRRIGCLVSQGGSGIVVDNSFYIASGVYSVESVPSDPYAFKVKFMPGYSKYQRPYVMCTSCNNANGISLAPFYNNSSAESGEVYFNLIDTGGNKVKPNELTSGMMFFIEIVCI
ncbi:hypothetical protein [Morganella morganii]|uniref:tail fiber/spike domain-containing protein n=1 Tax=Morganella morganii TaxID=582 RepID=UPI00237E73D5|nr:hypothetical protein [Morganella morganii]EKQ1113494.1 hypothetical protein [Morganella morganii]MDE2535518.1 hypothetical protein [Morganella morganii]HCL5895597.1 hypothetical protein [Morganella morganii]